MSKEIREQIDFIKNLQLNESTIKSDGYRIVKMVSELFIDLYLKYLKSIEDNDEYINLLSEFKLQYNVEYGSDDLNAYKNSPLYDEMMDFLDVMKIHYHWYINEKFKIYSIHALFGLTINGRFIPPAPQFNNQSLILIYVPFLGQPDKNFSTSYYGSIKELILNSTIHEVQHAYDAYISSGKNKANKKAEKFNKKYSSIDSIEGSHNNIEYLTLPHEINARITQLLNAVDFNEYENFDDFLKNNKYNIESHQLSKEFVGEGTYYTVIKKLYISFNEQKGI